MGQGGTGASGESGDFAGIWDAVREWCKPQRQRPVGVIDAPPSRVQDPVKALRSWHREPHVERRRGPTEQ